MKRHQQLNEGPKGGLSALNVYFYSWPLTQLLYSCDSVRSSTLNIVEHLKGTLYFPTYINFKGPGPRRQGPQIQGIPSADEDAPVYCGSVC